jgi:hypothetical protein
VNFRVKFMANRQSDVAYHSLLELIKEQDAMNYLDLLAGQLYTVPHTRHHLNLPASTDMVSSCGQEVVDNPMNP